MNDQTKLAAENHEQWKPAPGYEGRYEVSNLGSIRGVDRHVPNWPRGRRFTRGRAVGANVGGNGYRRATVGDRDQQLVHRLVAQAFVPNPDALPCVNHIDGDKLNNAASNLEWCTAGDNTRHGFRTGLIPQAINGVGDKCRAAKLTEAQVRAMKGRISAGESCARVAADYPVGESAIGEIKAGRAWGHVEP